MRTRAATPTASSRPGRGGANAPARDKGLEFTVHEADNLADFHGDPTNARLILYVGGNYFSSRWPRWSPPFESRHPGTHRLDLLRDHPAGLAYQADACWRAHHGRQHDLDRKNRNAYLAGLGAVERLVREGDLVGPAIPYVTNQLTIMVPKGNPAKVTGLADLARPGLLLAMPNPEFEGVARQIKAALRKAGGEELVKDRLRGEGGRRHDSPHANASPANAGVVDAGAGGRWRHVALGGNVPGRSKPADGAPRHPGRTERDGNIRGVLPSRMQPILRKRVPGWTSCAARKPARSSRATALSPTAPTAFRIGNRYAPYRIGYRRGPNFRLRRRSLRHVGHDPGLRARRPATDYQGGGGDFRRSPRHRRAGHGRPHARLDRQGAIPAAARPSPPSRLTTWASARFSTSPGAFSRRRRPVRRLIQPEGDRVPNLRLNPREAASEARREGEERRREQHHRQDQGPR